MNTITYQKQYSLIKRCHLDNVIFTEVLLCEVHMDPQLLRKPKCQLDNVTQPYFNFCSRDFLKLLISMLLL